MATENIALEATMATCQLIVHTPEGTRADQVDSWTSLVVLAALSAEPESSPELSEAVRRYQPDHQLFDPSKQGEEHHEPNPDEPWCLIDLVGRTVVAGPGFELPDPRGAYEADEDDHADGFPIVWLDTPDDWLFRPAGDDWRAVMATRASARAARQRVDVRSVLYGPPLLQHITDNALALTGNGRDGTNAGDQIRAVHAQWLMTARADLGGRTPRQLLHAERNRIDLDLQHRSQQWSRQGHPPPALCSSSPAYRFGGFGITEIVLYFHLVRALATRAWELATEDPRTSARSLRERLAEYRNDWLNEPNETTGPGSTPAALIESERKRLPVTSDGSPLDEDCPICQAEADNEFGPTFVWFDGHQLELEDEFAFSLCETREEWERQQEETRRFLEEMDRAERDRAVAESDVAPAGSVWQTSFVDWDALAELGSSPKQALVWLAYPLAELTSDLENRPNGAALMRSLNEAYAGLRAGQDAWTTSSDVQEFRAALEAVCSKFSDLTAKCADLQSRLDEVLRRLS